MRVHVNAAGDVGAAIERAVASMPGVQVVTTQHGSRTHTAALEIRATGNGVAGGQWGSLEGKSATWDEWGTILGAVFGADLSARVGSVKDPLYGDAEHFHWSTGWRFDGGMPRDAHYRHRWQPEGRSVTGTYATAYCRECSAHRRWMLAGYTFEAIR